MNILFLITKHKPGFNLNGKSTFLTHILTTQPSEHKSNALNRSAMALHYVFVIFLVFFYQRNMA